MQKIIYSFSLSYRNCSENVHLCLEGERGAPHEYLLVLGVHRASLARRDGGFTRSIDPVRRFCWFASQRHREGIRACFFYRFVLLFRTANSNR